jgi:hypothetical protein
MSFRRPPASAVDGAAGSCTNAPEEKAGSRPRSGERVLDELASVLRFPGRIPKRRETSMDRKLIGILLLAAGILGLAYGGFTYTRETHETEIGPLEVEVHERERVNIPFWVGAGFALGGAFLLLAQPPLRR